MKNRKVVTVRCHIGAGIQGKLSFSEKDPQGKELDGEMELWPVGVYVKKYKLLVPFTNVTSCVLDDEIEEDKRGPGRPPLKSA